MLITNVKMNSLIHYRLKIMLKLRNNLTILIMEIFIFNKKMIIIIIILEVFKI